MIVYHAGSPLELAPHLDQQSFCRFASDCPAWGTIDEETEREIINKAEANPLKPPRNLS